MKNEHKLTSDITKMKRIQTWNSLHTAKSVYHVKAVPLSCGWINSMVTTTTTAAAVAANQWKKSKVDREYVCRQATKQLARHGEMPISGQKQFESLLR